MIANYSYIFKFWNKFPNTEQFLCKREKSTQWHSVQYFDVCIEATTRTKIELSDLKKVRQYLHLWKSSLVGHIQNNNKEQSYYKSNLAFSFPEMIFVSYQFS